MLSYAAHPVIAVIANGWHYQNILTQFWVTAEFVRKGLLNGLVLDYCSLVIVHTILFA